MLKYLLVAALAVAFSTAFAEDSPNDENFEYAIWNSLQPNEPPVFHIYSARAQKMKDGRVGYYASYREGPRSTIDPVDPRQARRLKEAEVTMIKEAVAKIEPNHPHRSFCGSERLLEDVIQVRNEIFPNRMIFSCDRLVGKEAKEINMLLKAVVADSSRKTMAEEQ